jgi:hypothetical protein
MAGQLLSRKPAGSAPGPLPEGPERPILCFNSDEKIYFSEFQRFKINGCELMEYLLNINMNFSFFEG